MGLRPENDEEVLQTLDRRCAGWGNGARTAEALDISYSHLRQIKSGRRKVPKSIAGKLGFELRWVRVGKKG